MAHLPGELTAAPKARTTVAVAVSADLGLKDLERQRIQRVLEEEGWHRERAANRLGLPVRTLYRKIRAYDLLPPDNDAGH
jgi:DNA-binding NtrC family response regulator